MSDFDDNDYDDELRSPPVFTDEDGESHIPVKKGYRGAGSIQEFGPHKPFRYTKLARRLLPLVNGVGHAHQDGWPQLLFRPCGIYIWTKRDDLYVAGARIGHSEEMTVGSGRISANLFKALVPFDELKEQIEKDGTKPYQIVDFSVMQPGDVFQVIVVDSEYKPVTEGVDIAVWGTTVVSEVLTEPRKTLVCPSCGWHVPEEVEGHAVCLNRECGQYDKLITGEK